VFADGIADAFADAFAEVPVPPWPAGFALMPTLQDARQHQNPGSHRGHCLRISTVVTVIRRFIRRDRPGEQGPGRGMEGLDQPQSRDNAGSR